MLILTVLKAPNKLKCLKMFLQLYKSLSQTSISHIHLINKSPSPWFGVIRINTSPSYSEKREVTCTDINKLQKLLCFHKTKTRAN